MTERHADQGYRKFWSTMKELKGKERIQHFVHYYGKYTIIAILLLAMFGNMLYEMLRPKPDVILSGTAVNVHVSVDMEKRLTEDVFPYVGGEDHEKQEVTLLPNQVSAGEPHLLSALQTKVFAGEYHYALMDQTALDLMSSMQAFPELALLLPEEKLARWEGRFISVEAENGITPIAIDITGTPLAAGCTFNGDRIFLAFPVNMDTMQVVEPFYDYLIEQGLLDLP